MKNYCSIVVLFLLVLLYSCQSGRESEPKDEGGTKALPEDVQESGILHLQLEELVKHKKEVSLASLVRSIRYIPLETDSRYMIGDKHMQISWSEDQILIHENGKPVGLFDGEGKFLRYVGSTGRGPGEYAADDLFLADHEQQEVYVRCSPRRSILLLDFEGNVLKEFSPEYPMNGLGYVGNSLFCSAVLGLRYQGDSIPPKFQVFDADGKTQSRFYGYTPDPRIPGGGIAIMSPSFYEAPEGLIINTYENDSIYKVSPFGECEPVVSWEAGKYEIPFIPLTDYNRYMREKDRYIMSFEGLESEGYWFFGFQYEGKYQLALYDKAGRECFMPTRVDYENNGLFNDYDGGPSFWPFRYVNKGRYFLRLLYPHQLIKQLEDGAFGRIDIAYPEKNKDFKEMVKGLNESDNPVLMVVEMK